MYLNAEMNPAAICAAVQQPEWAADHVTLPTYQPTEEITDAVAQIVNLHRRRQSAIRAKTKLILAMKAEVRSLLCRDADFEEDNDSTRTTAFGKKPRKLTKAAQARVDDAIASALDELDSMQKAIAAGEFPEPLSEVASTIDEYVQAEKLFDKRSNDLAKLMVKQAKRLPAYKFAKSVDGLGDVSFATIVGECGDIGTYKSISAVWKRLGLAVINGRRQGNPGEGASANDWVNHGYSKARRSVSWNARQHVIGAMAKWRPDYGADVDDDDSLTEYQRIYAKRARFESEKLGLPIVEKKNAKGAMKESYKMHVCNRAHRYVEKRMIKNLYLAWRRAAA